MFSTTPLEGLPPRAARFTQQSTGDFDECLWDFGDGSTADECADQRHVYEEPGLFTVTLVVSGWAGSDEYKCRGCVNIFEPVKADFSVSTSTGLPPLLVTFRNLSTGDYDSCLWEFGDGHGSSECTGVTHVYSDLGRYTVKLTVSGDGGRAVKIVRNAVHVQTEPVANFSASPTVGHPPLLVKFADQSTGLHDKCTWDFGDGKPKVEGESASHVYKKVGSYTVTMTASGTAGSDTMVRKNLVVVEPYVSYIPGVLAR
jgi:PKD repeat protein